jgi:hypothetical protein
MGRMGEKVITGLTYKRNGKATEEKGKVIKT